MDIRKIETVGLVGLGRMGGPMVRHIGARGFGVVGYDVDPERMDAARKGGAEFVRTNAALARRCDMAIVVVGFDSEVEEAILGDDGLLAGARPGTVIAVGSTVAPGTMRRLAARLASHPVHLLDCPLARGEQAAVTGTMLTMVGGDRAVFEACRPVMESYADAIFHLGPLGAGQVGKMVNNLILWACISANYEGFRLGEALGVDPAALREALIDSSAQNWAMESRDPADRMPWAEKDMMLVLKEADSLRLSLPLCGVVKEVVKAHKIDLGLPMPKMPGE
jgi:3-hydroxyisobutyrate dehydrogenase-like beta-hydroxyacid dehydrogenase